MESVSSKKIIQKLIQSENNHKLYDGLTCREIKLENRTLRKIETTSGHELLDFINCSYLGLETHPQIILGAQNAIQKWGVYFSASRLRLRIAELDELDSNLKEIFLGYNIITFSNLTSAHMGVLPVIASGRVPHIHFAGQPVFIFDIRAHASLQQTRDSLANFGEIVRKDFLNEIEISEFCYAIRKNGKTPFLICDGVGSMAGNMPIHFLSKLVEKNNGYLYVDDAHGISAIGNKGCGYALKNLAVASPHVILSGSLSKGFGAFGGFVGFYHEESVQYIKKTCYSYTFSGPLPTASVGAALESSRLHLTNEIEPLQIKLYENLKFFDSLFPKILNANSDTIIPIRTIHIGDDQSTVYIGQRLFDLGFASNVAVYPVVKKDCGILRFAISAQHTKDDILSLYNTLKPLMHL